MAGTVTLTRVKLRTHAGFQLPHACACCATGTPDRQVDVAVLDRANLTKLGLQVALSAALAAAIGGLGTAFKTSGVATTAPVCRRCHWHCKVHEVAAVVAVVCGFVAGGVALASWTTHRAKTPGHKIGTIDLLLPFAIGSLVVGGLVFFAFSFLFAAPGAQCASRWEPVRCAAAGGDVIEFAFTSRAYAREFARLNGSNVVS